MIIVAGNLRITGKRIAAAVDAADPLPVENRVNRCVQAGARAIDINSGPLSKNPEKMTFLVRCVRNLTDFPLFIGTANPRAMAFGIDAAGENGIIKRGTAGRRYPQLGDGIITAHPDHSGMGENELPCRLFP